MPRNKNMYHHDASVGEAKEAPFVDSFQQSIFIVHMFVQFHDHPIIHIAFWARASTFICASTLCKYAIITIISKWFLVHNTMYL